MSLIAPHLGTATLDVIRDALYGKNDYTSAVAGIKEVASAAGGESGLTAILFKRHGIHRSCLKIVRTLAGTGPLPGILLEPTRVQTEEREQEKTEPKTTFWAVEPFLVTRKFFKKDHATFHLVNGWVERLLGYVEAEYEAMKIAPSTGDERLDSLGFDARFKKKTDLYLSDGPRGFFTDQALAVKWAFYASWGEWNHRQLPWIARQTELENVGFFFALGTIKKYAKEFQLEYHSERAGAGGCQKLSRASNRRGARS